MMYIKIFWLNNADKNKDGKLNIDEQQRRRRGANQGCSA